MVSAPDRLGQAPRTIETQSGIARTVSSVAANMPVGRGDGTATPWFGLVALGRLTERLLPHTQGEMINIAGSIQLNRWPDRDGIEQERLQILADSLVSARSTRPPGGKHREQPLSSGPPVTVDFDDQLQATNRTRRPDGKHPDRYRIRLDRGRVIHLAPTGAR